MLRRRDPPRRIESLHSKMEKAQQAQSILTQQNSAIGRMVLMALRDAYHQGGMQAVASIKLSFEEFELACMAVPIDDPRIRPFWQLVLAGVRLPAIDLGGLRFPIEEQPKAAPR